MLTVRRGQRRDLPRIVAIYNHAVLNSVATFDVEPVTVEERSGWLEQFGDRDPLFVAERAGVVEGYAYYLPFRTKAAFAQTKEVTVYVAVEGQRSGVGSALYARLIAHAREDGVHALVGVLGGENPASAALHRKFGFQLVGHLREVGRKFGRYVDTYYYELVL